MPTIRPYRPGDHDAVHEICIATADAGHDARAGYQQPDLLPEIFAHPYAVLDPALAFVLDDGGQAVGYVLGTGDTARFVRRVREEWLPLVGDRYPAPAGDDRAGEATPDEVMRHLLHTPERMLVPALAGYPAHLHIDLLPPYRRAGHGRALVATELAALRAAGAAGLHVAMVTANEAARPFYDRLGFGVLDVPGAGPLTYLGVRL